MCMWSMGKLYYAYHLYYSAMNNQQRIAPNKAMQFDNLRAVQLCAARCAPFVAHNRPARKLRLMAALDSDIEKH